MMVQRASAPAGTVTDRTAFTGACRNINTLRVGLDM
jgi:hypothetical protein